MHACARCNAALVRVDGEQVSNLPAALLLSSNWANQDDVVSQHPGACPPEMAQTAAGAGSSEDAVAGSSGKLHHRSPPCYLIVYNITKRHNIGNIARSATAFGVAQVCD